jgi:hypothetical protein
MLRAMKDRVGVVVCGTRRAAQWRTAFRDAGIEADVVETDTDEAEAGASKVLVPRGRLVEANAIVTAVTRGDRSLPGGALDVRALIAVVLVLALIGSVVISVVR